MGGIGEETATGGGTNDGKKMHMSSSPGEKNRQCKVERKRDLLNINGSLFYSGNEL